MRLAIAIPTTVLIGGTCTYLALAQAGMIPSRLRLDPAIATEITIEPGVEINPGATLTTTTEPESPNGLFVQDPQNPDGQQLAFPLKHTDVDAQVDGNIARVAVTQTFENPFDMPLEAVYVFPLPDEAAVDDMEIKIGDRIIKGEIKRREEAQEIYEQARNEGRTAGLLEQERANIFTQSLANIRPGEQIDVTIYYTNSLEFEKGNYEFVFPMVVGPRYIPGDPIGKSPAAVTDGVTQSLPDTTQVPDASRITPPVLKPGMRSGHDINVKLSIDAGVAIQKVGSTSHQIKMSQNGRVVNLSLSPEDTIPNKDLIIRYQVANEQPQTTVLTTKTEQGGHFATYLIPAIDYKSEEIVPKDVVFLMDTSGSQSGEPLIKSKELMRRFVSGLNPDDTFTIIDFANTTRQLSSIPLANTNSNRQKALNYINKLDANGGTELLNGINAVLSFPSPEDGRVRSVVLITDGYIGNDTEILAAVQEKLKPGNRLYSFGVGSSVNRYLLDRLAEVGRGTTQVVRQDENTDLAVEKFFQQINNPVLTNIKVEWQGIGTAPEIYPQAAPDLFANQPLVLYGRKKDRISGNLKITGMMAGNKRYEKVIPVGFNNQEKGAIAQLWGRARIKDLMNQMFSGETTTLVESATNTALSYNLLSKYTAFVAVSEEVRVNPDGTTQRVQVPVELPEGVSFEGVFGTDAEEDVAAQTSNFAVAAQPAPTPRRRTIGRTDQSRKNVRQEAVAPVPTTPPPAVNMPSLPAESGDLARASKDQLNESLGDFNDGDLSPQTEAIPESSESKIAVASPVRVVKLEGVKVVANTGITGNMTEAEQLRIYVSDPLQQHLQALSLPNAASGKVVLEFSLKDGRIDRIILDDRSSTITDKAVINAIKQALLRWNVPNTASGKARLTLSVNNG
ncbi:NAD(+) ADP-ribosyltransferase [Thalassoporum mexicanum PCC 7367]|uniref:VIT domain-containing protein n=1 Tax=Thalassoporum mexicanum TaxID=3457544 RepID=UPI00029F8B89|nr:VIT domain-containing protein [Pseudanabaena sp. PCC 7367]AFY68888.1 NAD(+) ADP-ribosyltransferase [Pseudanabaena sp. PCC 7367]